MCIRTELSLERAEMGMKERESVKLSAALITAGANMLKKCSLVGELATKSHSEEEVVHLLRGADVHDIQELKRQGLNITQTAAVTGFNRRTIRRSLAAPSTP